MCLWRPTSDVLQTTLRLYAARLVRRRSAGVPPKSTDIQAANHTRLSHRSVSECCLISTGCSEIEAASDEAFLLLTVTPGDGLTGQH